MQPPKRPLDTTDGDGDCAMGADPLERCTRARTAAAPAEGRPAARNLRHHLLNRSESSLVPGKWRRAMNG